MLVIKQYSRSTVIKIHENEIYEYLKNDDPFLSHNLFTLHFRVLVLLQKVISMKFRFKNVQHDLF